MCGIAGYISTQPAITAEQLSKAVMCMRYRGPDAEGYYVSPDRTLGLAHLRLSILDLSAAASQPMFSADGRYCMVFNGEVYNYQELKQQLPDKGARLRTNSDSEVILELFAQKGTSLFAELNGMFAMAIYDLHKQTLTLCRDQVGIKPLFCYADESQFIFASELKVIARLLNGRLRLNRAVIPAFFHLGFIPEPATIYLNTWKFPAAHHVTLHLQQASFLHILQEAKPFWQLPTIINANIISDEQEGLRQLRSLLYDAVQKQLISDVPIGTFLSGGIDSSLVTAIASAVSGNQHLKTFSIAIDNGRYNEAPFAREVAAYLHTDHHEFSVREQEVLELIDQFLPAYDEPFADSSALPTMIVSRLAKKHVTVALSGDGGDELFHGYGMYAWAKRLSHPVIQACRHPLYAMSKYLGNRYQRAGLLFNYPAGHQRTHIFSQEQYYFSEPDLRKLMPDIAGNFEELNIPPSVGRKLSAAEAQSLWDFSHYLKDDLLVKVDRASMQYSLETRVPLLDYRLVEFAYNLSPALKIKNGQGKYLLKKLLYEHVPAKLFNRPKWGFTIPLATWLKGELRYLLEAYTAETVIKRHGLVHYEEVKSIKTAYLNGRDYLYNRLWQLIILHRWLEENPH